jgi:hypothetical protein
MSASAILAHPPQVDNTQANIIELAVVDGLHYSSEHREYEIWLDGEIIAYACTQADAYRIYHEELQAQRDHFERCPEDSILWTRDGYTSGLEVEAY